MSLESINGDGQSINKNVSLNTFRTYSFINNSIFYPLVKKEYYDYYNRFIRYYFYWFDGFVPEFHTQNSGIFSTRLAYTLCTKLSGLINGGSLMFDNPDELSKMRLDGKDALQFMEKWASEVNLTNKNDTAITYSLAGGDSVYKLNSDGKDVYPTVLRKDNYLVDVNFKGEVTGFEGMIYSYVKMTKGETSDTSAMNDYYYLLEERRYNKRTDKPEMRIFVKVGKGNMTNMKDVNFQKIQEVPYKQIPKDVKRAIKNGYGDIKIDTWTDLPLDSIGIYLLKASESVSFLPQVPFGESILSNLISYLMSYDYYYSAMNTDMYIARGRIMLPKPMQEPTDGKTGSYNTGLDSGVYQMIPYANMDDQKPVAIQFENRADSWVKTRNNILQSIAMSLQISERTLANFLTDGSERATAREISVDDSTSNFVENKRVLYRKEINKMLKDVASFYNFKDEIVVRFSRIGLNNINDVVQQQSTLMQNDLTDLETALEAIHVDKNQRQIKKMAENILKRQKERERQEEKKQEKQKGTSDEDYKEENNTDINHLEKGDK